MAHKVYGKYEESVQKSTPTTGGTITLTREKNVYAIINPAGTLATLTINLPSSPQDADIVTISTSQVLTALTIGNGTIVGTLTTLGLGGFASFMYISNYSIWFRIG